MTSKVDLLQKAVIATKVKQDQNTPPNNENWLAPNGCPSSESCLAPKRCPDSRIAYRDFLVEIGHELRQNGSGMIDKIIWIIFDNKYKNYNTS